MVQASFTNLAAYLQTYGVMDFLLPFILVFTIVFAVLAKLPLFSDKKNFKVVIALVLALIFVVPHIIGSYPLGYDPVQVMNESLPSIALVAVAAVMLLILMGLFGTDFTESAAPIVGILAIVFVVYIFGAALNLWQGPYDIFWWWTPAVTELLIIILVFGVIVMFITRDPDKNKTPGENVLKSVNKLFKKE